MYLLGEITEYLFLVHVREINYWLTDRLSKIQVVKLQRDTSLYGKALYSHITET
jgi:hypothetical protein